MQILSKFQIQNIIMHKYDHLSKSKCNPTLRKTERPCTEATYLFVAELFDGSLVDDRSARTTWTRSHGGAGRGGTGRGRGPLPW